MCVRETADMAKCEQLMKGTQVFPVLLHSYYRFVLFQNKNWKKKRQSRLNQTLTSEIWPVLGDIPIKYI